MKRVFDVDVEMEKLVMILALFHLEGFGFIDVKIHIVVVREESTIFMAPTI